MQNVPPFSRSPLTWPSGPLTRVHSLQFCTSRTCKGCRGEGGHLASRGRGDFLTGGWEEVVKVYKLKRSGRGSPERCAPPSQVTQTMGGHPLSWVSGHTATWLYTISGRHRSLGYPACGADLGQFVSSFVHQYGTRLCWRRLCWVHGPLGHHLFMTCATWRMWRPEARFDGYPTRCAHI